jgi:hypothetical protein
MILPFRPERLRERAELDELDELTQARGESPAERLLMALELAELGRELADAANAPWIRSPPDDLGQKARIYASPLRMASRRK